MFHEISRNMILLVLCVCALTWPSSKCEPPVNSYLPSSNSGGRGPPTQYGPPERGGENELRGNRPGPSAFGNTPQNNYLPPDHSGTNNVNTQYGAPSSGHFGREPSQDREVNRPDSQYRNFNQGYSQSSKLTGSQNSHSSGTANSDTNQQSTPRRPSFGQRPESSYGPPPSGALISQNSHTYSDAYTANQASTRQEGPNSRYQDKFGENPAPPSSSYGVPGSDRRDDGHQANFREDTDEPAKYEFSYDVDDSQTGTKFGHSEQRDGDMATGEYSVVLPDGRKQVVEYEAGLDGFMPQIRYEGTPQSGSQDGKGPYQASSVGNEFPDSNHRTIAQEQYQETNTYDNTETEHTHGYPSGKPDGLNNGQRNGFPSHNSGQPVPERGYPKPKNNYSEGFKPNGANQDYSRCTKENNGHPQGQGCPGSADGNGRSRNGSNRSGGEGYPSGRPDGPIGTGY